MPVAPGGTAAGTKEGGAKEGGAKEGGEEAASKDDPVGSPRRRSSGSPAERRTKSKEAARGGAPAATGAPTGKDAAQAVEKKEEARGGAPAGTGTGAPTDAAPAKLVEKKLKQEAQQMLRGDPKKAPGGRVEGDGADPAGTERRLKSKDDLGGSALQGNRVLLTYVRKSVSVCSVTHYYSDSIHSPHRRCKVHDRTDSNISVGLVEGVAVCVYDGVDDTGTVSHTRQFRTRKHMHWFASKVPALPKRMRLRKKD